MVPSPLVDLRVLPNMDDASWDAFVADHPHGHFLQGAGWARLRGQYGWSCERVVVGSRGAPAAGAQLMVKRARLGSFAYVPRGPVCSPDSAAWPVLLDAIRRRARCCVALRMEPNWADTPGERDRLRAAGLLAGEATQPPSTIRIRIDREEEAILDGMKQKWRYNIRLAARQGVTVRDGTEGDLPTFERLMDETSRRDGFPRREAGYYAAVCRALGPLAARLHVAVLGEEVLAAVLVVHYGRGATYLYGASSGTHRQRMPNHALQWAAIRQARREGCRDYDLWGIPDAVGLAVRDGAAPEGVPVGRGGLWGVWGFKRGFGGRVWRSVGAWDDVYSPARYWLAFHAFPLARRWLARVRS